MLKAPLSYFGHNKVPGRTPRDIEYQFWSHERRLFYQFLNHQKTTDIDSLQHEFSFPLVLPFGTGHAVGPIVILPDLNQIRI